MEFACTIQYTSNRRASGDENICRDVQEFRHRELVNTAQAVFFMNGRDRQKDSRMIHRIGLIAGVARFGDDHGRPCMFR